MDRWGRTVCLIGAVGIVLFVGAACAKKSLKADMGSQSSQPARVSPGASAESSNRTTAATGRPEDALSEQDLGARAPGGGASGGGGQEPLGGFEPATAGKAPKEESVGNGTLVAKAVPSPGASERLKEMQQEQLATASAGLQDVFFSFDSWLLSEEGKQSLAQTAKWLLANPGERLSIEGHCDERGTLSYNVVLGEKRARAVRNYLVELGVDQARLLVVSFGKERPFCQASTEECYQQNRRGHLVVRLK